MKFFKSKAFRDLEWPVKSAVAKAYSEEQRFYDTAELEEFAEAAYECSKESSPENFIVLGSAAIKLFDRFCDIVEREHEYIKFLEEYRRTPYVDSSGEDILKLEGHTHPGYFNIFKFGINVCTALENEPCSKELVRYMINLMANWALHIKDELSNLIDFEYIHDFYDKVEFHHSSIESISALPDVRICSVIKTPWDIIYCSAPAYTYKLQFMPESLHAPAHYAVVKDEILDAPRGDLKQILKDREPKKEQMRKLKQAARSRLYYMTNKAKKHGLIMNSMTYTDAKARLREADIPEQIDDWNKDTDYVMKRLNECISGKCKPSFYFHKRNPE